LKEETAFYQMVLAEQSDNIGQVDQVLGNIMMHVGKNVQMVQIIQANGAASVEKCTKIMGVVRGVQNRLRAALGDTAGTALA
jgi:hypothetical protein